MNKQMLMISVLLAGTAVTPVCAVNSIADTFNNPRLATVSPEMNNPTYRAKALEGLMAEVETPFDALNARLGDATTLACEEALATTLTSLFHGAATNTVQASDYAALTATYNKLYTHLKTKTDVSANDISQFIAFLIARRITVAGIEFGMEQNGMPMSQAQQASCLNVIQKINDLTVDFLINVVNLPILDEEAQAQA